MEMQKEKNGELLYLLHGRNTWECERDLSISYLSIVESYLASNIPMEIIKLEEMDDSTYRDINFMDNANDKRIIPFFACSERRKCYQSI